jgi:hypothetical protein
MYINFALILSGVVIMLLVALSRDFIASSDVLFRNRAAQQLIQPERGLNGFHHSSFV